MIDTDVLHASLQFPVGVCEMMVAFAMVFRSRWLRSHPGFEADPVVTLGCGVFIGVIALKQMYWTTRGALLAADLMPFKEFLTGVSWFPIGCNAIIVAIGVWLFGRAAQGAFGAPASYGVGVVVFGLLIGIGAGIATWG